MTFEWQDRRWHVRLYLWAEPIVAKFFDTHSIADGRTTVNTNLCPYMRTLLLWFPLAILANLTALVSLVYAFIVKPIQVFGFGGISYLASIIVAAVVIVFVMSFVLDITGRGLRKAWRKCSHSSDHTPGLVSAVRLRAEMVHRGICPAITIKRTGDPR